MNTYKDVMAYLSVCSQRLDDEEKKYDLAYDVTPGWVKDRKAEIRSEQSLISRLVNELGELNDKGNTSS